MSESTGTENVNSPENPPQPEKAVKPSKAKKPAAKKMTPRKAVKAKSRKPAKKAQPDPQVIPLTLPRALVEMIDGAFPKAGCRSRTHLLKRALAEFFSRKGQSKVAAALNASDKRGGERGKGKSKK